MGYYYYFHFVGEEVSVLLLPRVAKLVIYNWLVWPQFQLTKSWSHCLPITPQVLAVGRKYLGPKAASLTHPCGLFQVGLFRKSGVKSRIHALRQMNENFPENVSYEDQSAYDVADMVKQFFRDLPEPLFTNKLSETWKSIHSRGAYSITWKPLQDPASPQGSAPPCSSLLGHHPHGALLLHLFVKQRSVSA